MTEASNKLLVWGKHPGYADGKWIKIARSDNIHEINQREAQGFELYALPVGEHPDQRGYKPGHPWYYKLGGAVHKPKRILASVKNCGYEGYMADDIKKADNKYEPDRTSALRSLRQSALQDLHADLARYRELACSLRYYRLTNTGKTEERSACSDIHTSISLKYNHLYNDFAHLVYIDELLSRQLDLFGF